MDPAPRKPGIAQYLRVSAADVQNPQNSFDYQRQRIQSSLGQVDNDLPVVAEYADILSGLNSKRPQYQKMLEDARRGKFSHLAVYSIDRLGRTTEETLRTVQELVDMGVEVMVADTPNLQMSTPAGNLLLGIRAVIAQYEVEMLSQRVKDTKRMMLLNGDWPAVQPDGYTRVREPGGKGRRPSRIVIDPERAKMWREAWDLLLTGDYTLKKICQELHNRGYTRKSGKPWVWIDDETGNTRYADTAMQDSFRRAFYAGWVVSEAYGIVRGEVRGNWEPIVTDAEFDNGIKIMRHNAHGRVKEIRHYYMLSGILYMRIEG